MEWLVPVLFVLASLVQWWVKHRSVVSPAPAQEAPEPAGRSEPLDEFGDLLEALGRRRHESPPAPPTLEKAAPPRILPPLETDSSTFAPFTKAATLASPIIPDAQEASPVEPNLRKEKKDPYSLEFLFRGAPTEWPRAVVLSEVLAPPVALR